MHWSLLNSWLRLAHRLAKAVTMAEIMRMLGIEQTKQGRAEEMRIGSILQCLAWNENARRRAFAGTSISTRGGHDPSCRPTSHRVGPCMPQPKAIVATFGNLRQTSCSIRTDDLGSGIASELSAIP